MERLTNILQYLAMIRDVLEHSMYQYICLDGRGINQRGSKIPQILDIVIHPTVDDCGEVLDDSQA